MTLATDVKNYLTPNYYGITVRLFINHQTWGTMWNEYHQFFNIKPPFEIANNYSNIISKFFPMHLRSSPI
ncbi:hypothetical protein SMM_0799 [Spiroplasma mirum ATCC 29335]|nr:hypothetical protein SMM_0799 [Spiroplasma mirum ATCC 29335]